MSEKEIANLLLKAADSIRAAELLLKEGLYGFSASRSYYAMFYLAEALLAQEGLTFSSHGEVISTFGRHFAKTKRLDPKLHRYLLDAFRERQIGDYEASATVTRETAEAPIGQAKEFFTITEDFLS